MTTRRRDLGTRGRVLVAAAAVGSAGVLAGWMAATDHTSSTPVGAASTTPAAAGNGTSSGSSSSAQPSDDDDASSAFPGSSQSPSTFPDASTGGS